MPYERLIAILKGGRDQLGLVDLGARQESATRWRYSSAGRCERPYTFELFARPSEPHRKYVRKVGAHLVELTMEVRCRKCGNCLKARGNHWTDRAVTEVRASDRTWFGTLTLRPEVQHNALLRARAKLAAQGLDFDALPPDENFIQHERQTTRYVTLFLKRLRKPLVQVSKPKYRFRYLVVAESHKSGYPHYHLLVHEPPGSEPIRKLWLEASWSACGFSQWRLVPDDWNASRPARYVCKYLTKSSIARVRASGRYGDDLVDNIHIGPQS